MFDFQKQDVYSKAKFFNKITKRLIQSGGFDQVTRDQLRRASFSLMLNIAEGSSMFSNRDQTNFMIISWGSAFECAAILDYLHDNGELRLELFEQTCGLLEEISRMLYSLIKKLGN